MGSDLPLQFSQCKVRQLFYAFRDVFSHIPRVHAEVSSLATNQYQILTMTNGMAIRAGVRSNFLCV